VIYSTGNEFSYRRLFDPSNFGELDNYRLSIRYVHVHQDSVKPQKV